MKREKFLLYDFVEIVISIVVEGNIESENILNSCGCTFRKQEYKTTNM